MAGYWIGSDMAKMLRGTLVAGGKVDDSKHYPGAGGRCASLRAWPWGPPALAQACAPGFVPNPYTPQCLAPVNTATINGVPCVANKLGLCNSFVQNQQPRRVPVDGGLTRFQGRVTVLFINR